MTLFTGTVLAEGFSEENFAKIMVGMSGSQVQKLLGRPLGEECNEMGCLLRYSSQDTDTADYDRRWISIDPSGKVEAVHHEFHID
jgi:hypothetical protein